MSKNLSRGGQKLRWCPGTGAGTKKLSTDGQKMRWCPEIRAGTKKLSRGGQKLRLCPEIGHKPRFLAKGGKIAPVPRNRGRKMNPIEKVLPRVAAEDSSSSRLLDVSTFQVVSVFPGSTRFFVIALTRTPVSLFALKYPSAPVSDGPSASSSERSSSCRLSSPISAIWHPRLTFQRVSFVRDYA
ncbi:MAG: hypothetical protein QM296_06090 [Bacillota bacterium]|nr:hypothetical protein [Bacillota bacterium]